MSKQITTILKRKLEDLSTYGELDAETRRNVLKEELQYYVLNFIYHHPKYSNWIMYGGSALRIIHGLNGMSVDLDFEIANVVTKKFLEKLKKEIEEHFFNVYDAEDDFITVKITTGRGLLLKFHIKEELDFGHPSKQVHIKIDLNHFVAPKITIERRPINHDQLSFVIITYNMSNLMASKLAAIFLRGTRGVGDAIYEEKGRDIYDLLWYMNKKIVPDFDYLIAKGVNIKDPRILFDKLTLQMNKVSDKNLKQDLEQLFVDKILIKNWLKNWRESYLRLLDDYKINIITELKNINIHQDFYTDNFSFVYSYKTESGEIVQIIYNISDHWIEFRDGDLSIKINEKLTQLIEGGLENQINEKLKQYITLFYEKTKKYFKKTNKIMLGNAVTTKLIRMTTNNLNPKEQIVLNKSALISCELDDLFK